jgi:hypothetical protein
MSVSTNLTSDKSNNINILGLSANERRFPNMRIRFLMATLFLFSIVASAYAQLKPGLRANIPFAFTVGKKQLPAGEYKFISVNEGNIRVMSGKETALATVLTRLAAGIHTTPTDAHIVFDKEGDQYFLAEIWAPGIDGLCPYGRDV